MRGYRGNWIGKVVVPALIVFAMVVGAWGTSIVPIASPDTTGGRPDLPSTRSGDVPSLLSQGAGPEGDPSMDVSKDAVSKGMIVNENALGRKDMRIEPGVLAYDFASGRAWDNYGRTLTLDPAMVPKDQHLTFTSRTVPTSELVSSDPKPAAGGMDAGGPYGGPDTFEGTTMQFFGKALDPNLVLYRWDFNGDGVWDTDWTNNLEPWWTYNDDYYGAVVLEGWDTISSYTYHYTGWSMETPSPLWYLYYNYYWTIGYQFTAKIDMTVNQLSYARYAQFGDERDGKEATLWDSATQAKLGECIPDPGWDWQRCTLSSPVTLTAGNDYMITQWLGSADFYYYYARGVDTPSDTDQVAYDATYYILDTPSPEFPIYFWVDYFIPTLEFYYDYGVTFPLTELDTADVEVRNVAPTVYDLTVSPDSVLEGKPAEFSGMFNDPGLDDQWSFRWCYGDGTCDDWSGIRVGSGLSQLNSILVYSDVSPHYAAMAMDFYGVSYEFSTDIFSLPTLITSQQWDLIIYQSYYIAYIAPIIEDAMMTQIAGGALIMYNNWYANNRAAHPIMQYFGAEFASSLFTPLTMYAWEPTNDLYNVPLQPPLTMDPTHNQYNVDGFKLRVLSNAFDPVGYTQNRQSGEVAMVVRNDLASIFNAFTPQNYQGDQDFDGDTDMLELLVNEIRLMTGPEVPPSMPWPVPPVKHVYRDDDPTTGTSFDAVIPTLEVKDDDEGKLRGGSLESLTDFESGSPWPTGWSQTEGWSWYRGYGYYLPSDAALWWYWYDYGENVHTLQGPSWDLSGVDLTSEVVRASLSWDQYWSAWYSDFYGSMAYQDGYVQVSTDNFATYEVVKEFHDQDPREEQATYSVDLTGYAGASNFRVRFTIQGYLDGWWHVDNVDVYAEWGTPIHGLGSASTSIEVNNVAPQVYGGPTSGLTGEAIPFNFADYKVDDPTLWDPKTGAWNPTSTEWFAYRWNFDDGTMSDWNYMGTLEVPKLKVLVFHTFSFGTGDAFFNFVRNIDVVGQVDQVDFLQMNPANLPTVDDMLGYDVIIFGTYYGTFSSSYDIARREIGNRLAEYMDMGGGVITLMATYDNSPYYGDLFTLLGRYTDEDYGAFEKTTYPFGAAGLGTVYQSDHPVMRGVTRLTSPAIHSGDYPLTAGAELLADWDDGNSAIGVKELSNGARSVNIGSFPWGVAGYPVGGDAAKLLRNAFTWASYTEVPTNDIAPEIHVFGDNGLYNVDLQVIDDDMGWAWDFGANEPVAIPGEAPTVSHSIIPVEIENQDPTIDTSSIDVYIAANVCLRVSGKEWNTVSLDVYTDGIQSGGVSVTRMSGSPNDQAKCAFTRIDLSAAHTFDAQVTFTPMAGATSGSNPWWVIVEPWREPITPGHGSVTFSGSSKVEEPSSYVTDIGLGDLKGALLDSGRGARIEFAVTAWDPGTDDLAFVWMWGDGALETINVHNNLDGAVTQGRIGAPQLLGFSEPYFDRAANDMRTPDGTTDFTVRDTTTHAYGGADRFFWVVLIILDDDNSRGYPSTFLHDGTDMEFILVDLT